MKEYVVTVEGKNLGICFPAGMGGSSRSCVQLPSLTKTLQFQMRSFAVGLLFHVAAWLAVLLAMYFFLAHGLWWPAAVALVGILGIDGFLIFRQWKRKTRFTVRSPRR